MLDLEPATRTMAELICGVRDDQLRAPTPRSEMSLGDLFEHVGGLSLAFTAAADKAPLPEQQGPTGDVSRLDAAWRTHIPERLGSLAQA